MFSCNCFSVFAKIVFLSGFVSVPSGNHGTVFTDIVIISFIFDKRILYQISLRSGSEIIIFAFDRMPAAPAVSDFVKIIGLFVNFQKYIFGDGFIIIAVNPVIAVFYKFSRCCDIRFLKCGCIDSRNTAGKQQEKCSQKYENRAAK